LFHSAIFKLFKASLHFIVLNPHLLGTFFNEVAPEPSHIPPLISPPSSRHVYV
jgi:hypothetical protein